MSEPQKRVPPNAEELKEIAAGIRQRQSMNMALTGMGARPAVGAHDLVYKAQLPLAAVPFVADLLARIAALEEAVAELKRAR